MPRGKTVGVESGYSENPGAAKNRPISLSLTATTTSTGSGRTDNENERRRSSSLPIGMKARAFVRRVTRTHRPERSSGEAHSRPISAPSSSPTSMSQSRGYPCRSARDQPPQVVERGCDTESEDRQGSIEPSVRERASGPPIHNAHVDVRHQDQTESHHPNRCPALPPKGEGDERVAAFVERIQLP